MTRYKDRKLNALEVIRLRCRKRLRWCGVPNVARHHNGILLFCLEQTKVRRKPKIMMRHSASRKNRQIRTRPAASAAAEYSPRLEERLDPFEQFQSLQVSLTPESRLVSITDSGSPAAEAFRLLGVRLLHLRRDRTLKKLLITSTIPQEGKSVVAGNVACTLAAKNATEDFGIGGRPAAPGSTRRRCSGLGSNPGLCEWLEDDRSLTTSVYHLEGPNIWILPAGRSPSNALGLLQSEKLPTLLDQLDSLFTWVIIDSPPVLPLADTSVWMRLADGILLTTRQGTTEKATTAERTRSSRV